jgi:hypothetical protein
MQAFEAEEKNLHKNSEMQRSLSDEGRFSLTSSPIENKEFIDQIESLVSFFFFFYLLLDPFVLSP